MPHSVLPHASTAASISAKLAFLGREVFLLGRFKPRSASHSSSLHNYDTGGDAQPGM